MAENKESFSKIITNDNLEEFKNWLKETPEPVFDFDHRISIEKIKFEDLIKDKDENFINLNKEQQEYLARLISRSDVDNDFVNKMLDNAKKYPHIVASSTKISGRSFGAYLYRRISDCMSKRDFNKNIPAIYAMVTNDVQALSIGQGELDVSSKENCRLIENIYKRSDLNSNYNMWNASTAFINDAINGAYLINLPTSSPEFRHRINMKIYGNKFTLNKLDQKFYTPELVREIVSFYKNKEKTTPNKAEPNYYVRTLNALESFAKKEEIHDRNNYGKLKSLTQRYEEMCAKLFKAKDFSSIDSSIRNGILKDGLIRMAQKDIINGDAEKLNKETLEMVLSNDKHNFYLEKIPQEVINNKQIRLNKNGADYFSIMSPEKIAKEHYQPSNLMNTPGISIKHKEKIVEALEKENEKNQEIIAFIKARQKERKESEQNIDRLSHLSENHTWVARFIANIQQKANNINRAFANDKPNEQEQHLSKENINKFFADFVAGKAKELKIPEQKALPLLFGRKKEEERREHLETQINEFNKIISKIPPQIIPEFKEYASEILSPKNLDIATQKAKTSENAYQNEMQKHSRMFPYDEVQRDNYTLEQLTKVSDNLDKSKESLKKYKETMNQIVKERLGNEGDSSLKGITADLSGDEKREIRKHNKTIGDKLEQKQTALKGKNDKEKVSHILEEVKVRKSRGK